MPEPIASFERGPYLQAAFICERVLEEKDGVKSYIRVVDRLMIQAQGPAAPEEMPPFETSITAVLIFKAGDATGSVPMKLTLTKPSGLTTPEPVWQGSVHFEGGVRGQEIRLGIRTKFEESGPYWFNLYVGERLATRFPLEIIYTFVRTPQAPAKS